MNSRRIKCNHIFPLPATDTFLVFTDGSVKRFDYQFNLLANMRTSISASFYMPKSGKYLLKGLMTNSFTLYDAFTFEKILSFQLNPVKDYEVRCFDDYRLLVFEYDLENTATDLFEFNMLNLEMTKKCSFSGFSTLYENRYSENRIYFSKSQTQSEALYMVGVDDDIKKVAEFPFKRSKVNLDINTIIIDDTTLITASLLGFIARRKIVKYDLSKETVVSQVPIYKYTHRLVMDSQNKYVLSFYFKKHKLIWDVYRYSDLKLLKSFNSENDCFDFAFSQDGKMVFMSDINSVTLLTYHEFENMLEA